MRTFSCRSTFLYVLKTPPPPLYLMCVALIVDEVGGIWGHSPIEEAVLVHVASLTYHLQAVVVLTAHVIL